MVGLKGKRVVDVSCGGFHTLCRVEERTTANSLYSWGSGYSGELGNGENADSHTPVRVVVTTHHNDIVGTRPVDPRDGICAVNDKRSILSPCLQEGITRYCSPKKAMCTSSDRAKVGS